MKKISFVLILLISLFSNCAEQEQNQPSEPITLAAIYNLTGDQSVLDIPSARGAQLAIQEANDIGGVRGRKVQLLLKDGKTNTDTLKAKVAEIMVQAPETLGFLGLSDTDQVLAAATAAAGYHRVFLTSGATSPQLPAQIPDYLFLACFGDNVQAAAAAEFAYETLKARTVSIVYDSTDTYTQLLQGYFATRFEALGGQVVASNAYGEGSMATAILSSQLADMIYFAALPQDVTKGIQLIRQAGLAMPVIGGDSYDGPDFGEVQDQSGEIYFTTHVALAADNADPKIQAFRKAYIQAYNESPNAFAALGYDAAQLMIRAIDASEQFSPEGLREALSGISDFAGVTGTISFDADNRIPDKSVSIMQIRNGKPSFVGEVIPQVIPAP